MTNLERPAAERGYAQVVTDYEGFGWREQAPLQRNYLNAVTESMRELGVSGTVAVEPMTLPLTLRGMLEERGFSLVDVVPALTRQRSTKTPAEIEALRACAELTAVGQRKALTAVAAGRAELEVFADIRCAMELHAGQRLPMTGDLISGADATAACMGWPGGRRIDDGDAVICDLAPRYRGYWGDSCNTLVVGDASDGFLELYRTAKSALERAVETLRPGITAAEFDAGVRGVIDAAGFLNPLHIGHGIGTSSHEYPRLVPHESGVLRPDMVLMVEPGAYRAGVGGVRLEWMFRVTETGNEVLSPYAHVLHPSA